MKLIWVFISPLAPFGYGVCTKNIVPRLMSDGHDVTVSSSQYVGIPMMYEGMKLIPFLSHMVVKNIGEYFQCDYTLDLYNYKMNEQPRYRNWVMCAAMDFPFLYDKYIRDMGERATHLIAPSKHNIREIEKIGFKPSYAPWGVNTKLFAPDGNRRDGFRRKLDIGNDIFVVGTVGANTNDDRKNLFNTIRAFCKLATVHPDVAMYIHCYVHSSMPLFDYIKSSGFSDRIFYPDQRRIELMTIAEEEMVDTYNSFDVFCCASKGESFGLPLVEAQSCGVPIIVTDITAMPEMCKGGWLIPVEEDDYEYTYFGSWWPKVRAQAIFEQLENAYQEWKDGKIKERGVIAREGMLEYDWDNVYANHWRPLMKKLEEMKCT